MSGHKGALYSRYARVALPVPLLQTFHYGIPDALSSVRPGCRVRVSFGRRALIGSVVSVSTSPPDLPDTMEIKPLLALVDLEPVLSPSLLGLANWMTDYYIAPPGDVFRAMAPPAASAGDEGRRLWAASLTEAGRNALDSGELPPETARVLTLLATATEPVPVSVIQGELDVSSARIKTLGKRGFLHLEKQIQRATPWKRLELPPVAPPAPTDAQLRSLSPIRAALEAGRFLPLVLHGVTGSGKTEVYLRAVDAALTRGRTALLLVPEISLTGRLAGLLQNRFPGDVAVSHSGLGTSERRDEWWRIKRGQARVVVGARRAALAPLENIGLIIVDEEHEASYKQEESPRYQARDVAVKRAKDENAVVILGSATPSLESFASAREGRYSLSSLPDRVGERPLASVELIDMKEVVREEGQETILSARLREALVARLESEEQSIVLLNRRGYATQILCGTCGLAATCTECSVSLTLHRKGTLAVCHYCGLGRAVPVRCDMCKGEMVRRRGYGTERIEEELKSLSADVRVARMDRDTMRRKGSYETLLSRFAAGELDVLVGTQMLAKGHDFPAVTLVGVLSADAGLGVPDFRAAERTFQLLTQVAGRAGRGTRVGEVLIQTFTPDHYALELACAQDFGAFFEHELAFRKSLRYPPTVQLINLLFQAPSMSDAMGHARRVAGRLRHAAVGGVDVLGPAFAARSRVKNLYRCQVLVKLPRAAHRQVRRLLAQVSEEGKLGRVMSIDVDPVSLA